MAELVDAHDSKSCFARSEFDSLFAHQIMQLSRINSLVELFFPSIKINSVADKPFLKWLKKIENFCKTSCVKNWGIV